MLELGAQGEWCGAQSTTDPIGPRKGFDVYSKKNEKPLKSHE